MDFLEACSILPDSPRASAALARQTLQALLQAVLQKKREALNQRLRDVARPAAWKTTTKYLSGR